MITQQNVTLPRANVPSGEEQGETSVFAGCPKQCIGMKNTETEQNFNPGLTLIGLSGTGP